MKKTFIIALLLGLACDITSPTIALAQRGGGGVFGQGDSKVQDDDNDFLGRGTSSGSYNIGTQHFGEDAFDGYYIGTQQFGQDLPLGNGWLVLSLAGVAYALKKRKNNHKKQDQ